MEGRGDGGEGVVGAKMFHQEISRTKESSAEVFRSLNTGITKCPIYFPLSSLCTGVTPINAL